MKNQSISKSPLSPVVPVIQATITENQVENDKQIYAPEVKDICRMVNVKNTGTETIKNAFLVCNDSNPSSKVILPDIEAGKSFNTIVIINAPKQSGTSKSAWKVWSNGAHISEEITFEFTVLAQEKPVEKIVVETKKPEKQFSSAVVAKAKQLAEFLPQYSLEFLLDAVDMAGNAELEDIMSSLL